MVNVDIWKKKASRGQSSANSLKESGIMYGASASTPERRLFSIRRGMSQGANADK